MQRKDCGSLERDVHSQPWGGLSGGGVAGGHEGGVGRDGEVGLFPGEQGKGSELKGWIQHDAHLLSLSPQRIVTTIQQRMSPVADSCGPSAPLPAH